MSIDEARLKKLKFRAWRRGFREADLILGPFADTHVASFSAEELDAFERLLEAPDRTSTRGSSTGSRRRPSGTAN